jgi:hypothetical protein
MATLYLNPMGYTSRRPATLPPLDRRALMATAHRLARGFRNRFGSYREAFAYGLRATWRQAHSARTIRSLALQVAASAPLLAATGRQHRMLGSYAYAGT